MVGRRRALLVATDSYTDSTFRRLRAPRADADALGAVLADSAIGDYEVEVLHDPLAHEAGLAIEDLFATASADDLVLLYLSGHGVRDDRGQLHLAMTNSRHDRLNATAVGAQFVRNAMDDTRSRCVVVIVDCCFAGAFPPGAAHRAGESAGVLAQLGGRGSAVFTSSSALEYSFEVGESAAATLVGSAQPSVFTGALLEGLSTGAADRDGDGLIDVDELYDFIHESVEAAGRPQTRGLDSRLQGRLIVAASWAAHRLPAEVAQALHNPLPSVRLAVVGELAALLGSGAAEGARFALGRLAEDEELFVATAARDALAQTGTSSGSDRGGRVRVALRRPWRIPWYTVVSAVVAVGCVAVLAVVALVSELPHENADPATQDRTPPGFVALPVRPTPLPEMVSCRYPESQQSNKAVPRPLDGAVPAKGLVRATINTDLVAIPVVLDRSLAPCTVNSFVHLAAYGFYEGAICSNSGGPMRACGHQAFWNRESGHTVQDESIPGLTPGRGQVMTAPGMYPLLLLNYESSEQSGATVLGTMSEDAVRALDAARTERDPKSGELRTVTITGITVEG